MITEGRELQRAIEGLADAIDDRLAPYKRNKAASHDFIVPGSGVEELLRESMLPNLYRRKKLDSTVILSLSLQEPLLWFRCSPFGRILVLGKPKQHTAEFNLPKPNGRGLCTALKLSVFDNGVAELKSLRVLPQMHTKAALQITEYSIQTLDTFWELIAQAEDICVPSRELTARLIMQ